LVLEGGCNAVAKQPAEIVTAVGAAAALLVDEPASSALRVKRVPATTLHLSNIDAQATVATAVERSAKANAALGIVKILQVTTGSSGNSRSGKLQNRRDGRVAATRTDAFLQVHSFTVNYRVPSLAGPLDRCNAPRDQVKKCESHRRLSVAVRIHQKYGEGRNVACTVVVGRQQFDTTREAVFDAAGSSSGALQVRAMAGEHDSGAELKVAVDALNQPAKQVPADPACSKAAAGVGLEFAIDGSNQLLKKTVQLSRHAVCGLGAVAARCVATAHDVVQQQLQRRRQTGQGALTIPKVSVTVRRAGCFRCC
jgi:hypothetical protein